MLSSEPTHSNNIYDRSSQDQNRRFNREESHSRDERGAYSGSGDRWDEGNSPEVAINQLHRDEQSSSRRQAPPVPVLLEPHHPAYFDELDRRQQQQASYEQSPYPSSFSYHPSSGPAYASIHSYNSAASNNSFEPPSPQNDAPARSFLAEYTASPFNVPSVPAPVNSNSSSNAASLIPSSGLLPPNVPSLQIPSFPHQQEQQRYNDQQYSQQPSYQSYQSSHPAPSKLNRTSSSSPQQSNLNDLGLSEPDAPPYPSFPAQQQPLSQRYGDSPTTDLEDLVLRRQPLPTRVDEGDNDDYQPQGERSSIDTASSSSRPNTTENEVGLVEGGEPMIVGAGEEATADEDDGGKGKGADCTAFISKLWHLLTHPEYARYLQFNSAGDAFILMNANEFAIKVLPRFFRHSNVASFVRQLNLYNFQRVSTIQLLDMADETASTAINHGDPVMASAETYNQPSGSYTHHDFEHHTDGEGTFSEGEGHGPPSPGGPRKMGNTKEVAASGFTHQYFRQGRPDLLCHLKPRGSSKKTVAGKKAAGAVDAEKKSRGGGGGGSKAKKAR